MKLFALIIILTIAVIAYGIYNRINTPPPTLPSVMDIDFMVLDFDNAYAYATTSAQKNGAAFMTITSKVDTDEKIVKATSPVAERVELHTHTMDGDVMMMREVDGYDIPAGETIILEPTGHHIMLMGLKTPLIELEDFPITITTQNEREIDVIITVKNPGE